MMAVRLLPLVATLLLVTTSAATAQLNYEPNPKKDPYRHLFAEKERALKNALQAKVASTRAVQKPSVVCGTLIVPADPAIDPKIKIAPRNDGVEHKLRIVTPPICKPE